MNICIINIHKYIYIYIHVYIHMYFIYFSFLDICIYIELLPNICTYMLYMYVACMRAC